MMTLSLFQVQHHLADMGLYDPWGMDGKLGPLTRWAAGQVLGIEFADDQEITDEQAQQILAAPPLPLVLGTDHASLIIKAYQARGAWVGRHPLFVTLGYVEALNPNFTPNDDVPNHFDAVRTLIRIDPIGQPRLIGIYDSTTTASRYWTENPMNPNGAARIALGQQWAWSPGDYHNHPALKQVRDLHITRDPNVKYTRYGPTYTGLFGIHHHRGYNEPHNNEGHSSAGCQVCRLDDEHDASMAILFKDIRIQTSGSYIFNSTVIRSSELDWPDPPYPDPSPAPGPAGGWQTNIKATNFSGPRDHPYPMPSYYGGNVDWQHPGYALPFNFKKPPLIDVRLHGQEKIVLAKGMDLGPWYDGRKGWPVDPYWQTNARPRAESDHRTNGAGIDLTPGAWKALGLDQNTGDGHVDWRMHLDAPEFHAIVGPVAWYPGRSG